MEGKGYWLFLLIMYGLSALMKRRQQTAARKKILERDESFSEKPKPKTPEPADLLREMFGGAWLEEEEPAPVIVEDTPPVRQREKADNQSFFDREDKRVEVESEPIEPASQTVEPDTIPEKVREDMSGKVSIVTQSVGMNAQLLYQLKNKFALKNSILIREILDKPRALRRSIR